jgi:hypothetical protein
MIRCATCKNDFANLGAFDAHVHDHAGNMPTIVTGVVPTYDELRQALNRLYVETLSHAGGGWIGDIDNPHLRNAVIHAAHMMDSHIMCDATCAVPYEERGVRSAPELCGCGEDCDPETAADHADDTSVFAAPNQGYSDAEIRAITGR